MYIEIKILKHTELSELPKEDTQCSINLQTSLTTNNKVKVIAFGDFFFII